MIEYQTAKTLPGCSRCGSLDLERCSKTSSLGTGLFVAGLVGSLCTVGLSLLLCVIGPFVKDHGYKCRKCGFEEMDR